MRRRNFLQIALLSAALTKLPQLVKPAAAADALNLTDKDRETLAAIERYLNGISTVQGRFIQSSSNGSYAEGNIWIERPDNMRFEYDPPVPLLIIAANRTLALYDKELKQISQVPVWDTPLWFLFEEQIKLDDSLVLTKLEYGAGEVVIRIQEEQAEGNLSSVTLTFSEAPVALRKWEVIDGQGVIVQTGLVNPVYGNQMNPDLFDISLLDVYQFTQPGNN